MKKCKKSLFKSTYKRNAFIKGKTYKIDSTDERFIILIDELGNEFDFSKEKVFPFYYIDDYFE